MAQTAHRVRTKLMPPVVPVADLVIEGRWAETLQDNPQPFLIYDNRRHARNARMLIFASRQGLEQLSTAEVSTKMYHEQIVRKSSRIGTAAGH